MEFPDDLMYTSDHEWIKPAGSVCPVGITDHAQGELGDVVYIDIPDESATVAAGDSFGTIEAVKTVADILAPVSGKIVEVNKSLNDNPEIVNTDPYGEGWIIKLEISDPAELDSLMDAEAYRKFVGK